MAQWRSGLKSSVFGTAPLQTQCGKRTRGEREQVGHGRGTPHPWMPRAFLGLQGTTTTLYCPGAVGRGSWNDPLDGHSPPLTARLYVGYLVPQTGAEARRLKGLTSPMR